MQEAEMAKNKMNEAEEALKHSKEVDRLANELKLKQAKDAAEVMQARQEEIQR